MPTYVAPFSRRAFSLLFRSVNSWLRLTPGSSARYALIAGWLLWNHKVCALSACNCALGFSVLTRASCSQMVLSLLPFLYNDGAFCWARHYARCVCPEDGRTRNCQTFCWGNLPMQCDQCRRVALSAAVAPGRQPSAVNVNVIAAAHKFCSAGLTSLLPLP